LDHFEVFRDGHLHASVESDVYEYVDTITEGLTAEYFINAVYSDNCEAASETLIGYANPTQVTESAHVDVQIYPNPVEGDLTVKAEGLQQVVVYNQLGQKVTSIATKQDECIIPMNYPQGIYFIQLITQNGVANKTVVVK
jgi:hypothetical protein